MKKYGAYVTDQDGSVVFFELDDQEEVDKYVTGVHNEMGSCCFKAVKGYEADECEGCRNCRTCPYWMPGLPLTTENVSNLREDDDLLF